MPPAYSLREISFSYGRTDALLGVTLDIVQGERVALLGANGSGKSTLLRLLGALAFGRSGSLQFFGQELTEAKLSSAEFFYGFRRRVGIVFQNADVQLFNATVFDEVAFGPLQLGWERGRVREVVEQTLSSMFLADLKDRPPHQLSGGEKKRVALASVLVTDPEVLLLDEPTGGLDPPSQESVLQLLASWQNSGRTVVVATHDLGALESMADRCLILQAGRLAGDAPTYSVLHDLDLLERTGLMRRLRHRHHRPVQQHGHFHQSD